MSDTSTRSTVQGSALTHGAGSTGVTVHADASPVGLVETITSPRESVATQSEVDGHEMESSGGRLLKPTWVHVPDAGSVEKSSAPV